MKFKLKVFPSGRREWLWMLLQLILFFLLFTAARLYVTSMPGHSHTGPLPALSDDEASLSNRLKGHVSILAGKIGERNLKHYEALKFAGDYIRSGFQQLGYQVAEQEFVVDGKTVTNIEVEMASADCPAEIVVVGAHYDSVYGSPGANDNATGVAALLELAGWFKQLPAPRTMRFVAFVNEEPPYFQTANMGSRLYARRCHERGENVTAMFSLETIGYYSDAAGSQIYPFPFKFFYPTRGNFLGFVGNMSSRSLVRKSIRVFRENTAFPSEGIAAPGGLIGIGWSDQWSFWEEGYPGVMITDSAIFRYKQYHKLADTPDKIDYDRMARAVAGLTYVLSYLGSD